MSRLCGRRVPRWGSHEPSFLSSGLRSPRDTSWGRGHMSKLSALCSNGAKKGGAVAGFWWAEGSQAGPAGGCHPPRSLRSPLRVGDQTES